MSQAHTRGMRDGGSRFSGPSPSAERRARMSGEVLVQSIKDMLVDNGPSWAAAIAYYMVLSIVPVILLAASIASLFVEPQWAVDRITNILGDFVPETEGLIEETVNNAIKARGQVALVSFIMLLWSGTRVFDNLTRAMNVTFNVDDDYSGMQRLGIQVAMLLTLGVFFILAIASGLLIEPAWEAVRGTPGDDGPLMLILTWIVRTALLFMAYYLIFRFVPRRRSDNRALLFGAATTTCLFLIGSTIFGWFIAQSSSYNQIYGPLAMVAIAIVWIGISAHIVVFGGEIVSHVQEMVIEGKSAEDVGRRHAERSPRQHEMDSSLPDPGRMMDQLRS